MSTTNSFRQGVTLYSFQSEYCSFQHSFEDCMQLASQLGDRGVEIVGPMHHRCYPEVSNEFERVFKNSVQRYQLTPTSYGGYADASVHANEDEVFEYMLLQLKGAHKLGFPVLRIAAEAIPVVQRLLPYAEKYNMKLGPEVHAPMALGKDPRTVELVEFVKKVSSPFLGLIPDGGVFTSKVTNFVRGLVRKNGVSESDMTRCDELFEAKIPLEKAREEFKKFSSNESGLWALNTFYGQAPGTDPQELRQIMPYIIHFHGKFWDWENGQEPAIPYDQIVRVLVEGGYKGWMSTEFEGGKPEIDSFVVVKGFQEMIRGHAAKYATT